VPLLSTIASDSKSVSSVSSSKSLSYVRNNPTKVLGKSKLKSNYENQLPEHRLQSSNSGFLTSSDSDLDSSDAKRHGKSLAGIGKMLNIYYPSEPKNRKKNNVKQMNDYLLFLIVKANRKLDERLNAMFKVLQQIERKKFLQQLID